MDAAYHSQSFVCLVALTAVSVLLAPAYAGSLCSNPSPYKEKAYNGPYTIYFPDSAVGRQSNPSRCTWKIQSYRADYVIKLEFHEVSLTKNAGTGVCWEQITVYDGPETTSSVMASFCGTSTPEMVTSSREALVVFTTANASVSDSSQFRLKYRAVVERHEGGDTSHILRIAFGSFIGAVTFIVVCSGVCRKYKQAHPRRSFFQFGRPRVNSATPRGSINSSSSLNPRSVRPEEQQPSGRGPTQRLSFRKRITGFFQDVLVKLTPARYVHDADSMTHAQSNHNGAALTPAQQQLRRAGQEAHMRNTRANGGRGSASGTASVSELSLPGGSGVHSDAADSFGHVQFGYQNIPTSSFTSDPAAVKPPTYEECVNSVNPLYLYHHQQGTFTNPVFSIKDEPVDPATSLSPPPPYSEFVIDTGGGAHTGPPQVRGETTHGSSHNADGGQHQREARAGPAQFRQTVPAAAANSDASESGDDQAVLPSAPVEVDFPQAAATLQAVPNGNGCESTETEDGKDARATEEGASPHERLSAEGKSPDQAAQYSTRNARNAGPSTIMVTSSSTQQLPTLLDLASSSLSSSSLPSSSSSPLQLQVSDAEGQSAPHSSPRDADVSVGVGGARLRERAEESRAPPLTPVYLNQDTEAGGNHRPRQPSATRTQSLTVTQTLSQESSTDLEETESTEPSIQTSIINGRQTDIDTSGRDSDGRDATPNAALGATTVHATSGLTSSSADSPPSAHPVENATVPLEMLRRNGFVTSSSTD